LYAAPGAQAWARQEITWGIFGIPEDELDALPADVAGIDVVELGCGTAYFGAWLARRGARVTGIDNSAEQLKTARRLQDEHDLHFPLIHGNAEDTGLPDASFDLAISEYGAAIWADPYRWIPEAARIPRPSGELTFLGNGTFWVLTVPETDRAGSRSAVAPVLRDASVRLGRPVGRRVLPRVRRLDPAAASERLRGARPARDPGS
jgi:ubiquinone/menaquinone biosynthesis C-methylase UbiE